ncbi:hypothetical protein KOAAANKH_03103 [Brevundimonas sp. NIBR10]|uniref:hypothetical protein n=1 Tax=Brevundimonas sp. NIBR10 TaxID=3015997 RepID=UPI0022F194E4|nr:hypothetical protein [Brevundimonas sp. NIBR10]WGM48207.1 hypothetical protein KOAAANKH_03103 [Brevundimonas sp. NIBR10]
MSDYPTLSIGPRDRGRSYGVLHHSLEADDFARARPRLEDFALALAAWADLGLTRFAALTPLEGPGGPAVLWRARFIGAGELGSIAVANGLFLSETEVARLGGQAHRLLGSLPEPDGSPFGVTRLSIGGLLTAGPDMLAAFGLEWRDQVLDLLDDADPEAVAIAALDGISPRVQQARIDGWATTGSLRPSGGFDPDAAFRLIVRPQSEPREPRRVEGGDRAAVELSGGRIMAPPQSEPASWRAWQAVQTAVAGVSQAADTGWKPAYQALLPDRSAALALLQFAAPLTAPDRLALISRAVSGAPADEEIAEALSRAAGQALVRLAAATDEAGAGDAYLEAGLTEVALGDVAAREVVQAAPIEAVARLGPAATARALEVGLIERVAAAGVAAVAALGPDLTMTMLGKVLGRPRLEGETRALAVGLIRRLSGGEPLSRRYAAAGVAALMERPADAVDVGLARVEIAGLVRDHPRIDRAAYAERALRPVLRRQTSMTRPDFIEGLRAVALILEPAA